MNTFDLLAKYIDMESGIAKVETIMGVSTSGTKTTIVDTNKEFITNMFANSIVKFTTEDKEYFKTIVSNTADTITFTPALAGAKATATIGEGTSEIVVSYIDEGVIGNVYDIEIVEGDSADSDLSAILTDSTIVVSLGTDSGDAAIASIGTGTDGTVNLEVVENGIDGNDYTIEVVAGTSTLSFVIVEKAITITLAENGSTAGDIATLINSETLLVDAVASGTGLDLLTLAESATFSGGGDNFAVDDTKNTATLVATEINALDEFTCSTSNTGVVEVTTENIVFSGGVDTINVENGSKYEILNSLATGASTSAKQDTIISHVDGIETALTTLNGKDFSTEAKLEAVRALLAGTLNTNITNRTTIKTATITSGTPLSTEIDLEGYQLAAIEMPSEWTAAGLTFQGSSTSGGTYKDIKANGLEVTEPGSNLTATANVINAIDVNALALAPIRYLKIRSGTSGSAVNQTADRTLTLILKV